MKISRRNLIKVGAVGTGCVAVTGGAAWMGRNHIRTQQPGELAEYLKSHFEYLNFTFGNDQFVEFTELYRKHYLEIPRKAWHLFRGGDEEQYQEWMDHLAAVFLMSTNLFLNGGDESKPIDYVAFYHPYVSSCWSPFKKS